MLQTWDWDMWMRKSSVRKNRECIIPDVPRTYHFGVTGVNMNSFFHESYFRRRAINNIPDVQLHQINQLVPDPSRANSLDFLNAFIISNLLPLWLCHRQHWPISYCLCIYWLIYYFDCFWRNIIGLVQCDLGWAQRVMNICWNRCCRRRRCWTAPITRRAATISFPTSRYLIFFNAEPLPSINV